MDGHRTAERRSLAYHRAIAERIAVDPNVVASARTRVRGWSELGQVNPTYIAAWQALLDQPTTELTAALGEDSERMTMLRQMSPFAGALDPRTRWEIWRSVA